MYFTDQILEYVKISGLQYKIFYIPYLLSRLVRKIEILLTKMQTDVTENLSQTCN